MAFLLHLLLLVSPALCCFLNSCPYRRYGRNTGCGHCGVNDVGLCIEVNRCCTATECFPAPECRSFNQCPPLYCKIGQLPGFCMARNFCCTNDVCQRSLQC